MNSDRIILVLLYLNCRINIYFPEKSVFPLPFYVNSFSSYNNGSFYSTTQSYYTRGQFLWKFVNFFAFIFEKFSTKISYSNMVKYSVSVTVQCTPPVPSLTSCLFWHGPFLRKIWKRTVKIKYRRGYKQYFLTQIFGSVAYRPYNIGAPIDFSSKNGLYIGVIFKVAFLKFFSTF